MAANCRLCGCFRRPQEQRKWSGRATALRTYLWALSLQAHLQRLPLPIPSHSRSIEAMHRMLCGSPDHSSPRPRHAVSYDSDTSVRSPRLPRLSYPRIDSEDPRSPLPSLKVNSAALTYSLPLARSPSPSIILTPPSPSGQRRDYFTSSFSSCSEYPSETSSQFDEEDLELDCDSARSDLPEAQTVSKVGPEYARVLQAFRESNAEEAHAPLQCVSDRVLDYVTRIHLKSAREVLTLDTSEILCASSSLRPGVHGFVVPRSSVLAALLTLHARCNSIGCHVFISRRGSKDKGTRYQYHGFYRVIHKDTLDLKEKPGMHLRKGNAVFEGRQNELYPFFLQFLRYDWELFHKMDIKARCEAQGKSAPESSADPSSEDGYLGSRRTTLRTKPSAARIVTVDGVDFEIVPTPVTWNHGPFRKG